jgi:hypothetical protein
MVLEKSVRMEVKEVSEEERIGIAKMECQGKLVVRDGEPVVDPTAPLYVGDYASIYVAVEKYVAERVNYLFRLFDNGIPADMYAVIEGKMTPVGKMLERRIISAEERLSETQIFIPCKSAGIHTITAKIALG